MDKFINIVNNIFNQIIDNYNLTLVPMDESEVFLVFKGFALSICISREGADIYYIIPNSKSELIIYRLSNSLQDRFTEKDRACYGNPSTQQEHAISELKVYASGIYNHWRNLLNGDKTWFSKYQGKAKKANIYITRILTPIFVKQNTKK